MLSLDPVDLGKEIRNAKTFIRKYAEKRSQMIRRYAGAHYRTDLSNGEQPETKAPEERMPENYLFAYQQFLGPQLVFGRPIVRVTAVRAVRDKPVAQGIEAAINHWSREGNFKAVLAAVRDDVFMGFGVTKCGIQPRGDYAGTGRGGLAGVFGDFESVPNWPFCIRVDPRDFLIDPLAKELSKARYIGHCFERDLADVQADERYDAELVASMHEQETERETSTVAFPETHDDNDYDRKRVRLIELYLPEHGRILTLWDRSGQDVAILRNEPYWGPDEGPYTIWGLASVPGELLPISPTQALYDQIIELNAHARQAANSAAAHKKIGIYQVGAKEDAKRINDAKPGDMVAVKDPASVRDFELGGVSNLQMGQIEAMRMRLDRDLGFTDAQRGRADPKATATAAEIANASSDLRVSGMKDRFVDSTISVYRKIAWYFFNDDSIGQIEMSISSPTGEPKEGVFIAGRMQGGAFVRNTYIPPPPPMDFTDLILEIDPRSLSAQNDALEQKRAVDTLMLIMQLAPIIPQVPWVNWRHLLDSYGQAFNLPDFSAAVLNDQFMPMVLPNPYAPMQPQRMQGMPMGGMPPLAQSPVTMPGMFANAGMGRR
jgi:hypothetical protein